MDTIVNKVAQSGLMTLDLEQFMPSERIVDFDIKPFLFMELIVREKDFRESLDQVNFEDFAGVNLAVYCSADAIIPEWAWMLIVAKADPYVKQIHFSTADQVRTRLYEFNLSMHDWSVYTGRKVMVKGCGDNPIPSVAYIKATENLMKYADRIMYGEACSFVPVWRKQKAQ
jgi:hypothetical protein